MQINYFENNCFNMFMLHVHNFLLQTHFENGCNTPMKKHDFLVTSKLKRNITPYNIQTANLQSITLITQFNIQKQFLRRADQMVDDAFIFLITGNLMESAFYKLKNCSAAENMLFALKLCKYDRI